ncbi:MAG: polymer-forming cytoskeletal protein [Nitrospirota bacterium]|nr:polymer-forming cytoskeletal protein [Nitrospirota bacterium]
MWGQEKQTETSAAEPEREETGDITNTLVAENTEGIIAFVGKGVEFKGTISYSGTVRIDGYLDGEIHTEGILLVGEDAVIQAKITAGTVVCKGKITGNIVAKERVKLRAPAVVSGSVKTPVLSMEDGVLFNGDLEMAHTVRELPREAPLRPVGVIPQPDIKRING